jgi:hypothetical protein
MNQGPRYVRLMEKSRGQKSRATVPLIYYDYAVVESHERSSLLVKLCNKEVLVHNFTVSSDHYTI